jgi:hypothetical protein
MNAEKQVAEFLNDPVYPDLVPMTVPAGFKWVFAREVALKLLGDQIKSDPKSAGFDRMSNDELKDKLLEFQVLYPEYMGGVVNDGAPNGLMPAPEMVRHQ